MRARSVAALSDESGTGQARDDRWEPAQQGEAARHREPAESGLAPDDAHRPERPWALSTCPDYDARAMVQFGFIAL